MAGQGIRSGGGRAWTSIVLRLVLCIVGGYLLAAGVAGLVARALARVMPPSDAVILMAMLAFVLFLGLLLWGVIERRFGRLWLVFGLGAPVAFLLGRMAGEWQTPMGP